MSSLKTRSKERHEDAKQSLPPERTLSSSLFPLPPLPPFIPLIVSISLSHLKGLFIPGRK